MSEEFISRSPTAEEMGAEVLGVTWDQFSAYTQDEVEELRQRLARQAIDAGMFESHESFDQAIINNLTQAMVFSQFVEWRRYGVPDRNVSSSDVNDYLRDLIAHRQAANPAYGALPKGFNALPRPERIAISYLFGYFRDMRDAFEYQSLDEYSLYSTIGFSDQDVANLQTNNVLEPINQNGPFGKEYILAEQYHHNWLVLNFGQRITAS